MPTPKTEMFEIVDEQDRVVGIAPRSLCHGNPTLIHRVAHVLVFRPDGELLLQKRSRHKDIQPGKWDTSVGGHLDPGEDYRTAAIREMREELGLSGLPLTFLYPSKIRNEVESENVATFLAVHGGAIRFSRQEIEEVRFWRGEEIDAALGSGLFTPNFEEEWRLFQDWSRRLAGRTRPGIAFCGGESFPDLLREWMGSEGER